MESSHMGIFRDNGKENGNSYLRFMVQGRYPNHAESH